MAERKEDAGLPSEELAGRDVAAIHDPRPVCIVGARGGDGRVGLATVIWATPVSHEPPLVAFALRERSHTMGLLQGSGRFSLCLPPATPEGAALAEACGNATGHVQDKGSLVDWQLVDGLPVALPCEAYELCAVRSIQEAGDHLLVVGEVERAATACTARDGRGRLLPSGTLLCIQHGAYGECEPLRADGATDEGGASS